MTLAVGVWDFWLTVGLRTSNFLPDFQRMPAVGFPSFVVDHQPLGMLTVGVSGLRLTVSLRTSCFLPGFEWAPTVGNQL